MTTTRATIPSLAAALTLQLAATAAAGPIVFDNGGIVVNAEGNETTQWVQADDFVLASGGVVADAGVYIGSFVDGFSNWDGTLDYWIFADAGGSPGAILSSGAAQNVVQTDTGMLWSVNSTGNAQLFEFDLASPFNATAGTAYWFGIHMSSNFDRDEIYWVLTGNGNGHESNQGTFDNWSNNGGDRAYFLTANVPEPSTLLLLGLGVAGLISRRRRSQ